MERSEKILQGLGNQYYRATLKSMGFTPDEIDFALKDADAALDESAMLQHALKRMV